MVLELEFNHLFRLEKENTILWIVKSSIKKSLNYLYGREAIHLFSKISLYPWRTLYGGKKNLVPSELQLHSISSLAFAKSKSS